MDGSDEDLTNALRMFYDSKVKIKSESKDKAKDIVSEFIKGKFLSYIKDNSQLNIRKLEYTGSQYEKLKTEAADEVDIMFVMETNKDVTAEKVNEVPGWARIRVAEGSPYREYANKEGYIITDKIRQGWMMSTLHKAMNKIKEDNPQLSEMLKLRQHGPAVQIDITDKETGKMVSADVILTFEFDNALFVAKPYKHVSKSKNPPDCDTKLLFRQSFSLKEKALLRDMDKGDHGCRHILLRVVKTIVRNESPLKGKITTYHLKTAFLRLMRETQDEHDYWHRDKLGVRFKEFMIVVMNAVNAKSLPHYWVKDVDLFDGVEDIVLHNMGTRLKKILSKESELFKILGVSPATTPPRSASASDALQSNEKMPAIANATSQKLPTNKKVANAEVDQRICKLLPLLRAFTSDMGKPLSKEIQWAKDTFNAHVKDGVLQACKDKHPGLISKFEYTGNLFDSLKTAGKDDDDVTVLITLKKNTNDVIHEIHPGFAEFRTSFDPESQYAKFCDKENFILPDKIIKWLFSLARKETETYKEKTPMASIKTSQLKDCTGVRLELNAGSPGPDCMTLLVNLVPTFEAEPGKVFSTAAPLGWGKSSAVPATATRRCWGQSFAIDEKMCLSGMDGKDKGCRHELFKIVKTILKREPAFAKLVGHLKGFFLEFNDEESSGRLWDKDHLSDRFVEFLTYLRDVVKSKVLKHHWMREGDFNVLVNIKPETLGDIECRLGNMIRSEQEQGKILTYLQ